ncbi:MAG: MaoC family dehydratase N-terminal domain-containing protein [Gammaproteobacteria bacterium]
MTDAATPGAPREMRDTIRAQPAAFMHALLGETGAPPQPGAPLPPGWHWLFFLEAAPHAQLGADGHAAHDGFAPPPELPRRMWAGGRLEFAAPLRIGENITRKSVMKNITHKRGRSGKLCFVTVRHEFFHEGAFKMSDEHDIVYREDAAPASPPAAAPADADARHEITADAAMLFRYSALTFNSHRIHYDPDYCREVEGYPAQVVHGPLTATLLARLAAGAAAQNGGALASFAYRAVSPLFAMQPFTIAMKKDAQQDAARLQLWAANAQGKLAMRARAAFA